MENMPKRVSVAARHSYSISSRFILKVISGFRGSSPRFPLIQSETLTRINPQLNSGYNQSRYVFFSFFLVHPYIQ